MLVIVSMKGWQRLGGWDGNGYGGIGWWIRVAKVVVK